MPPAARPRHDPTDDWVQFRLLITSSEQETYELPRPMVLFGQPPATRARDMGPISDSLSRATVLPRVAPGRRGGRRVRGGASA